MRVKKRNGSFQEVSFDKVTNRIKLLCKMLPELNKIDASNLKNKWFGTLARRGFSYETAKKVFEINNLSEAENIINRTV